MYFKAFIIKNALMYKLYVLIKLVIYTEGI